MDVNSGTIHVLDDVAYAVSEFIREDEMFKECPAHILDEVQGYSSEEIVSAYNDIYELYKTGYLFTDDSYIDREAGIPKNAPVKALCLNVAHDCNLRCEYCFASKGDFGLGRKMMDSKTAKNAIDFVISRSANRHNIEVDFFGGEPLMNFGVVKETVEYARSIEKQHNKNFRFTITTNGLLLDDDKIEYINREMSNVVLSLDGGPGTNDNMRKTVDGRGSYDHIMPKFKNLVSKRDEDKDYYLRGTFTSQNLNFTDDVKHIADEGFKHISVEPVTSEPAVGYDITSEHLPKIFSEYEKLCDDILDSHKKGKPFNFFHFFIDLEGGPCVVKRLRGCGAGYEYVAVTPEGDIYPCHQFVGKDEFKQGNVNEMQFDLDMAKRFANMNIFTRNKCDSCFAKFYCSGGCSAANNLINQDMNEPYEIGCQIERKRVECSIYLKSQGL